MAQTDVNIDVPAGRIADPGDVPVVQGDTVTITVTGGPATLFFSHDCRSVLSPPPESPSTLNDGDSLDFTFTSSTPGSYMVMIAESPSQHPHFPPFKSTTLSFTTLLHSVRGGAGPSSQLQGN